MDNIYQNKLLKYPLADSEYNKLDQIWEFLEIIFKPHISPTQYRKYAINYIQNNFDINKFFEFENIINKLFWNLRWLLFPLFTNNFISQAEYHNFIQNNYNNIQEIPNSLLLFEKEYYTNIKNKIQQIKSKTGLYYRSFINKIIIPDNSNKIIYYKNMEGSSDIFSKNPFNLLSANILLNKPLYEKIMADPYNIKNLDIQLSQYYFQYDYIFPNLNLINYSIGNISDKLDRIKKFYFSDSDKYWFKIIL